MKTILGSILIAILFIFPLSTYLYAKTLGQGNADCMITYIQEYYPLWAIYKTKSWTHIDKRWLIYMDKVQDINWCYLDNINNSLYCYWTLILER